MKVYKGEYFREKMETNKFGISPERLVSPVRATVADIDFDECNKQIYRVGLSSLQAYNLGIEIYFPPNSESFLRKLKVEHRIPFERVTDGRIFVEFGDKKLSARVYNAIGPKSLECDNVRLSFALANDLRISKGERVILYSESYNAAL